MRYELRNFWFQVRTSLAVGQDQDDACALTEDEKSTTIVSFFTKDFVMLDLRLVLIALISLVSAPQVTAQSAFDDFMAAEETAAPQRAEQSETLRNFSEILNGDDRARSLDALKFLLYRDEPEYHNFATEFGVFSTDPAMREMALQALFDRRRQHRFVLDIKDIEGRAVSGITDFYGGVTNAETQQAYVTITTTPYDSDADCWKQAERGFCAFILTGDAVSLRDWTYVTGNLELNDEGAMVGTMSYRNGPPIPARLQIVYD